MYLDDLLPPPTRFDRDRTVSMLLLGGLVQRLDPPNPELGRDPAPGEAEKWRDDERDSEDEANRIDREIAAGIDSIRIDGPKKGRT